MDASLAVNAGSNATSSDPDAVIAIDHDEIASTLSLVDFSFLEILGQSIIVHHLQTGDVRLPHGHMRRKACPTLTQIGMQWRFAARSVR